MVWFDSPNFFCEFLETLMSVANIIFDNSLPVPRYGAITNIPKTVPVPPHTLDRLTHIYFYMNDIITAVQVRTK